MSNTHHRPLDFVLLFLRLMIAAPQLRELLQRIVDASGYDPSAQDYFCVDFSAIEEAKTLLETI